MSHSPVRVPQIKSEIAVAIAFLDWTLRQLADYGPLVGLPIGEAFLEDALDETWPDYRSKSDPIRVENLIRVLGGLGVELHDDVFGVVRHVHTRVPFAGGLSAVGAVTALVGNYPKAQLKLVIQEPLPGITTSAVALLINPGNRFLLCDHPDIGPVELINYLYANCLDRLVVADSPIRSLSALSAEDAIRRLTNLEYRLARHLSRVRVAELLRAGD